MEQDFNPEQTANEIAKYINELRKSPQGFMAHVQKRLDSYQGKNFD